MRSAREVTNALGGQWHGSYGTAACPVCQPERRADQVALTVKDAGGRLLAHCKKGGCAFVEIIKAAGVEPSADRPAYDRAKADADAAADAAKRSNQAWRIWESAVPFAGTLAEAYLQSRGLDVDLPDAALRFAPRCWHRSGHHLPAMIGLFLGGSGRGVAVHRTYIREDGSAKASVEPAKAALGASKGKAILLRQGTDGDAIVLAAEGIESALSAWQLTKSRWPGATVVAAGSASNLAGLVLPPARIGSRLVIARDGDGAGLAAAHALGDVAHQSGWGITILSPQDGFDFNDVLQAQRGVTA